MFIKTIEWLDSDNKEAELEISDGLYTLIAFCYPCSYFIGQNSLEPLECLNAHDIASAELDKYNIIKAKGKFEQECSAFLEKWDIFIKIGEIRLRRKLV